MSCSVEAVFTPSVDGHIARESQMSILEPLEKGQVTLLVSRKSNKEREHLVFKS